MAVDSSVPLSQALGSRLKRARELLDLNQTEAAEKGGVTQRDVSQIESGVKKFIPTPYLSFLAHHIELSTVFDPRFPVTVRVAEGSIVKSLKDGELRNQVLDGNERLKRQLLPPDPLLKELQERIARLEEEAAHKRGAASPKRKKTG
ncbi:MAG: helix-turn-helix transcriptional regulator [Bacteroidetes bacterium]|nr:helix-turn-helix transcriptional regulator [Bacteroidota bacterium]